MSHLPELSYIATSTPIVGREEQWMPYSARPVFISPLVLWLGPQEKKADFVSYEEGGMIGYATSSICHAEEKEVSLRVRH